MKSKYVPMLVVNRVWGFEV